MYKQVTLVNYLFAAAIATIKLCY